MLNNNQKIILILAFICLIAIFQLTGSTIPDYVITIFSSLITSIIGITINTHNNRGE